MTNDRWVFEQRFESIWPWNWQDQKIEFYRPKIVGSIFYTIVPFWKTLSNFPIGTNNKGVFRYFTNIHDINTKILQILIRLFLTWLRFFATKASIISSFSKYPFCEKSIHKSKYTWNRPQFKVERDKTWKTSTNTLDWIHFGLKIAVSCVMKGY